MPKEGPTIDPRYHAVMSLPAGALGHAAVATLVIPGEEDDGRPRPGGYLLRFSAP